MMSVATTSRSGLLTRNDLDALRPEEGVERYELLDGAILVTPGPGRRHQSVVLELAMLLRLHRPSGTVVKIAPFAVVLSDDTELQPDVLLARQSDLTDQNLPAVPLLVVEVLSRSTRGIDVDLKRRRYEQAGVPSYWLIDPEVPSVTVLELRDHSYETVASATGEELIRVDLPIPVQFTPGSLLAE